MSSARAMPVSVATSSSAAHRPRGRSSASRDHSGPRGLEGGVAWRGRPGRVIGPSASTDSGAKRSLARRRGPRRPTSGVRSGFAALARRSSQARGSSTRRPRRARRCRLPRGQLATGRQPNRTRARGGGSRGHLERGALGPVVAPFGGEKGGRGRREHEPDEVGRVAARAPGLARHRSERARARPAPRHSAPQVRSRSTGRVRYGAGMSSRWESITKDACGSAAAVSQSPA